MSQHNYTNPAFCQSSEFYPIPSSATKSRNQNQSQQQQQHDVEQIYNRSLNLNFNAGGGGNGGVSVTRNVRDGPLRIQRSMSTRSFVVNKTTQKTTVASRKPATAAAAMPTVHKQQHYHHQQHQQIPMQNVAGGSSFEAPPRSACGRYALVPVEELQSVEKKRYAIVPGSAMQATKRFAKSQEHLDRYNSRSHVAAEEPHSFHEEHTEQYTSLPPVFDDNANTSMRQRTPQRQLTSNAAAGNSKIKHAFSSDFGSKSFLIVDKNSNQRYQMVPTAEDEELVDDNQEIIQMHNGRAHRYAVIPTEDQDDDEDDNAQDDEYNNNDELEEEETCLSTSDLNHSQNFLAPNYPYQNEQGRTPMRTSTPQKGAAISMMHIPPSYPSTPLKNPAATKKLHEILSTPPRKMVHVQRNALSTPRAAVYAQLQRYHQSQQQIYYTPPKKELSPQRLHYETVKPLAAAPTQNGSHRHQQPAHSVVVADRTTAVITPRVASAKTAYIEAELEDCSSLQGKPNIDSSYPQKIANATITLAVVSLMLVLGSSMNSALVIYMIAHFGKSFYLQFSLVASFCGVGLGFLGFRSRHCEFLPNRSYTSGYILVTVFCLFKCCGLLVILVLDPFPGLPLHDVTTGVILGLSAFSMFFIGMGVLGSLWCYRPPPDNRVNVV